MRKNANETSRPGRDGNLNRADLLVRLWATWIDPFATDADPRNLLLESYAEIKKLRAEVEALEKLLKASADTVVALTQGSALMDALSPINKQTPRPSRAASTHPKERG